MFYDGGLVDGKRPNRYFPARRGLLLHQRRLFFAVAQVEKPRLLFCCALAGKVYNRGRQLLRVNGYRRKYDSIYGENANDSNGDLQVCTVWQCSICHSFNVSRTTISSLCTSPSSHYYAAFAS